MREKVGKSRFTMFFQWFVAPEGRKVGSLKRRVRSQLARWEMKNCTPLWREAHFQVKMYKTHHSRTTFGSCDVKKCMWREAHFQVEMKNTPAFLEVAMSKKCTPLWREAHFQVAKMYKTQNTSFGHFWEMSLLEVHGGTTFDCDRKSARRCGAKHISKSKCTKHTILGPLLEVQISKKCTPLWREAHLEVKMLRTLGVRTPILEVQISRKCTPLWREAHLEVKMLRTLGVRTTILEVQISKKCTPLWREAHLEVKMLKTLGVRTIFGSSDLEKVHAVVVRSTFGSQTVKNTRGR